MGNFIISYLDKAITSPLYGCSLLIFITAFLYVILFKLVKTTKLFWIRAEFAWIAIGILGVLFILNDAEKHFLTYEKEKLNNELKIKNSAYKNFLKRNIRNSDYNYQTGRADSAWLESINKSQDIKTNDLVYLYSLKDPGFPYKDSIRIEKISQRYLSEMEVIINRIGEIDQIVEDTSAKDLSYSFGILLMFVGLSIRILIVLEKIRDYKSK